MLKLGSNLESLTPLNCNVAPKECDRPPRAGEETEPGLERIISYPRDMTYTEFLTVKSDLMNHAPEWPLGTRDLTSACQPSVCPVIFFFFF